MTLFLILHEALLGVEAIKFTIEYIMVLEPTLTFQQFTIRE